MIGSVVRHRDQDRPDPGVEVLRVLSLMIRQCKKGLELDERQSRVDHRVLIGHGRTDIKVSEGREIGYRLSGTRFGERDCQFLGFVFERYVRGRYCKQIRVACANPIIHYFDCFEIGRERITNSVRQAGIQLIVETRRLVNSQGRIGQDGNLDGKLGRSHRSRRYYLRRKVRVDASGEDER